MSDNLNEQPLASAEDLLAFKTETRTERRKIGPLVVELSGVINGLHVSQLVQQAMAKEGKIYDVDGQSVVCDRVTAMSLEFLAWGAKPKMTFEQWLKAAVNIGVTVTEAGQRVLELSGLSSEAVDEAKND